MQELNFRWVQVLQLNKKSANYYIGFAAIVLRAMTWVYDDW